jgi:hypothetical protein
MESMYGHQVAVMQTNNGIWTYPIVDSVSREGYLPDDDLSLAELTAEQITQYSYSVGHDQQGNDIKTCLVGVGYPNIHNVYRYNDGTWKFLFRRSI